MPNQINQNNFYIYTDFYGQSPEIKYKYYYAFSTSNPHGLKNGAVRLVYRNNAGYFHGYTINYTVSVTGGYTGSYTGSFTTNSSEDASSTVNADGYYESTQAYNLSNVTLTESSNPTANTYITIRFYRTGGTSTSSGHMTSAETPISLGDISDVMGYVAPITVSTWSWTASNGSASATQTLYASRAINHVTGYSVEDFNYKVWNDLVNKVNDCLSADSKTWATGSYASLNNTLMSANSKTLTAVRFNSLVYNLRRLSGISITTTQGRSLSNSSVRSNIDTVYGSYFTDITTAINNWINSQ